jgi:hypothetical protein
LALSVLDHTTGNMLEHRQLQCGPWYKTTWKTLYSNVLGCLCQAIGSGKAPNSKRVAGTNTFFCIDYNNIPSHKRKEICHTMVVLGGPAQDLPKFQITCLTPKSVQTCSIYSPHGEYKVSLKKNYPFITNECPIVAPAEVTSD